MPTPSWRARLAERRVKPGDGRPLPPFRWWQVLGRSLFLLDLEGMGGATTTFAVDVRQLGDRDDGEVRARLYRDGLQVAVSRLPARFAVPGGHIEVAARASGLRRCHYVPDAGEERQLTPHPRSAEGLRARLHHRHPVLSRVIGVIATAIVLVGVCITVPQLVETISQVPAIADSVGTFTSPIRLPTTVNIALTIAVILASMERALRLRSSWLDELAN
jgi:catechol 2,3-dioxygenase-like lactoylglutathione lyase family enzyme